jgi:hypothetical protein
MATNSTYRPPLAIVSDTDRGGSLLIFNTIGLVIGLVSVSFRVFLSASTGNGFVVFKDDVLCYAALVTHHSSAALPKINSNLTTGPVYNRDCAGLDGSAAGARQKDKSLVAQRFGQGPGGILYYVAPSQIHL